MAGHMIILPEPAYRLFQSKSPKVSYGVCLSVCLSTLGKGTSQWTRDFWSKSVLLILV